MRDAARTAAEGVPAGDEAAFAARAERHRRELQLHCYRMLGSLEDAEDVVQETFLRAWRSRATFTPQGPGSFRAWLYRIATNASLDLLKAAPRSAFPWQPGAGAGGPERTLLPPENGLAWLQPYPDELLDGVAPADEQPEARLVARETVELAFIVAVQLLPATQRAVLILRDVVGWPAKQTAAALGITPAAANSALQRARTTLQRRLPRQRVDWTAPAQPTEAERALVRRYLDAHERSDVAAMAALLHADARLSMPPTPSWFAGREAIAELLASWHTPGSPAYVGDVRQVPIQANRQLGSAGYVRRPDDSAYRAIGLQLLRTQGGAVTDVTMFVSTGLFPRFGLPLVLPDTEQR